MTYTLVKTLGILGGGQLGRMSAMAAARLGIKTHIFCPERNCPASQVSDHFTCAEYESFSALKDFAKQVDVISYEFENIPVQTVSYLKQFKPVYPGENLLEVSQDRLKEKKFLNDVGIKTARWAPAKAPEDLSAVLHTWNNKNAIIKTTRFGYDGKGQIKYNIGDDAVESWTKLNTDSAIIEEIIDFSYEASIIVARDLQGRATCFPVVVNEHKNHILSKTYADGRVPHNVQLQAKEMALVIAEKINLTGVLALEIFVTQDGEIIANEIAPRTHNSGHWTMDACAHSQFDFHVRAVCGLPLPDVYQHSSAVMINLIGDDIEAVPEYMKHSNAVVHLYGKEESRSGRKMGHINILNEINEEKHEASSNA